jgi:hypothetical protein
MQDHVCDLACITVTCASSLALSGRLGTADTLDDGLRLFGIHVAHFEVADLRVFRGSRVPRGRVRLGWVHPAREHDLECAHSRCRRRPSSGRAEDYDPGLFRNPQGPTMRNAAVPG